jgi:hypothetical protein
LLVRLEVALAVDELLLTVAEREAVAAEWELGKASLARSMRLAWSSARGNAADFLASSRSCRGSGTRASGEVALASRILSWL